MRPGASHTELTKQSPRGIRPSITSLPAPCPSMPLVDQHSAATVAPSATHLVDTTNSPKSTRPWKRQMKRVSHLHRQHGRRVISSDSSSLTSIAGADRPPWEVAMDNLTLARRLSTRSTESSTPSRHRPESTRTFSKMLFHRRAASKQNRYSRDSSGSSVYSADVNADNGSAGSKEFLPTIFSRKKPQREDATSKRPQISEPFNFQHVAHERREDHATHVKSHGRMMSTQGPSSRRFRHSPVSVGLPWFRGSREIGGASSFSDSLSHLSIGHPDSASDAVVPLPSCAPRAGLPPPSKLTLRQRRPWASPSSSPSTSPTLQSFSPTTLPGLPSPWTDRPSAMAMQDIERPQTSDGFVESQPHDTTSFEEHAVHPLAREAYVPDYDSETSSAVGRLGDMVWPSSSLDQVSCDLPQVQEEEEEFGGLLRRSRLSFISTTSALRGCQSVPAMRTTESECFTGVVPESPGHHDGIARSLEHGHEATPFWESWEDDIDYCYDHEVEANCNYQWERPSLETARGFDTPPVSASLMEEDLVKMDSAGPGPEPRCAVCPASQCSPALSPSSQASTENSHGAITPFSNPAAVTDSPPAQVDARSRRRLELKDNRCSSSASGFREPQVVPLSPTLSVPSEFQQQLLLRETEFLQERSEAQHLKGPNHYFGDDEGAAVGQLGGCYQRCSLSTATESTVGSDLTEKRHMSTASSQTALTQHTASSTSLNKMASSWTGEAEHLPAEGLHDVVPELPLYLRAVRSQRGHKSHASDSMVSDEVPPRKSPMGPKPPRQRARTSSFGIQTPPPPGQYALFPRAYVKAAGGQI